MQTWVKIILTLLFAFVSAMGLSFVLERGQSRYHVHKLKRMNEIFEKGTPYDILFIGSSRTHTTVYPKIIDSLTGLSSYNAGVEGGNLYEFKLTLDGYLVHHPAPRLAFLTLDGPSFDVRRKMFFPVQYFDKLNNPAVYNAFKSLNDYSAFLIKNLPFLRMIYYDDYTKNQALQGLFNKNELSHSKDFEYKGFLSNGDACIDSISQPRYEKKALQFQQEGVSYLKAIIDTCRARNIQLIFTYAPEYNGKLQGSFTNFNDFLELVENLAAANGIRFYRDDSLPLCRKPCLFANYGHVNTKGALEYSTVLGKRIADTLPEN